MAARYDFGIITNLGNVADPVNAQDAATKAYVDNQPAGEIYFDSSSAIVISSNNLVNSSTVTGTISSLNVNAGPGNSAAVVTYFSTRLNTTPFYLTGFATPFYVSNAVAQAETSVTLTFVSDLNLGSTSIASGSNILSSTYTVISDIALGANLTGAVANNLPGRPTLTITATGGTSSTVSVNGTTVTNPNFQNNADPLGLQYSVSGANVQANIRSSDVSNVATAVVASRIGSVQGTGLSGSSVALSNTGNVVPAVLIVTIDGTEDMNTLAGTLNAGIATHNSDYIYSRSTGLRTAVQSYAVNGPAVNRQLAITLPAGTTQAQLYTIFPISSLSNTVEYGSSTVGEFVFQPLPEAAIDREISSQLVAGSNITLGVNPNNQQVTINSTGGADTAVRQAELEPTGFPDPNRTQTTIAFNNTNRTFTITPTGASFTVWVAGVSYTKTAAESIQIPNTSGLYYIAYNTSGQLVQQTTYFVWDAQAPVAYVYWNATDQQQYFFGDERHGTTMDWATHEYLHRTRGAAFASGYAISGITTGNGTNALDAQIGLTAGTFFDEDIELDFIGSTIPVLSSVFYRRGTEWVSDANGNFPYKLGTNLAAYNLNTSGIWSVADISNNNYGVMWVCATNDPGRPIISIMGQANYSNLGQAEAAQWSDLDLTGLPIFEFRVLYKLSFLTQTSYTNAVKAASRNFEDWRTVEGIQLPDPTYDAVDATFRATPQTVFLNDPTAFTNWQNVIQSSPSFASRYDVTYPCVDNQSRQFVGILNPNSATYSGVAQITFTSNVNNDSEVTGIALTWTTTPPTGLISGSSVVVFSQFGNFNLTEGVLSLVTGNWFLEGSVNCAMGVTIPAGTYTVSVVGVIAADVASLNNIAGDITLAAGTGIGISNNTGTKTITIANTQGGGGGSASTVYAQPLFPEITATTTSWANNGRGYVAVPAGAENTGGIIQGITYIDAANSIGPEGFGMQMQTSIGGTNTPYSDLTFRLAPPTLNNVVINVSNSAGIVDLTVQVLLVDRAVLGSGDAYLRQYQHPLTTAPSGDGTSLEPIHIGTVSNITILSGTQIQVGSISGVLWDKTVPANTAYTGVATRWIPVYALTSGDNSPDFTITGIVSIGSVGGDGSIEIDLALSSGGGVSTPSLQQVVNVGNALTNTGSNVSSITLTDSVSAKTTTIDGTQVKGQSLVLDGATIGSTTLKTASSTTSYQITLPAAQGANGQTLINDGSGNLTWSLPAAGTVTSVSVVSANGLAGTVATATTTPAITLSTTVTGLLRGNGTAISAAVAGTDYQTPISGGGSNVTSLVAGTNITFNNVSGALTISATEVGTGTVTSVSVVSANGLAGTVATATTTPAITLSTTVTGLLRGNGTAISAAVAGTDYEAPITSTTALTAGTISGSSYIWRGLTSGTITFTAPAVAGTQSYTLPAALPTSSGQLLSSTTGGALSWVTASGTGSVTSVAVVTANGLAGTVSSPNTAPAITLSTTVTGLLKGNGTAISAAVAGTDYQEPITSTTALTAGTISGSSYIWRGATSGTITFTSPAVAGTQSYTLPTAQPTSNGQILSSTTGGTLSWVSGTGGTVTNVSILASNGFSGSVTNPTTTPQLEISTTVTGLLKGNGLAVSAAVAGTDYQAPISGGGANVTSLVAGTNITFSNVGGALTITGASQGTGTVTSVSVVSANGLAGTVDTATTTPAITLSTTITGVLRGNGTAISAAVAGTDYQAPITSTTPIAAGTISGSSLSVRGSTSGSIAFFAPAAVTTSQSYSLPSNYPTSNGQILSSSTGGALSWVNDALNYANFVKTADQTTGTTVTFPALTVSFGSMASTGIFTFSQTGQYLVVYNWNLQTAPDGWGVLSGSSIRYCQHAGSMIKGTASQLLPVASVGTTFYMNENNGGTIYGSSGTATALSFIKIA